MHSDFNVNTATFLCPYQSVVWISSVICRGPFCVQWFGKRGDCSFCWYLWDCWSSLFTFLFIMNEIYFYEKRTEFLLPIQFSNAKLCLIYTKYKGAFFTKRIYVRRTKLLSLVRFSSCFSNLSKALELSALGCLSTHNNPLQVLQRTIGPTLELSTLGCSSTHNNTL